MLLFAMVILQNCSPTHPKKTELAPSASPVQEQIEQLKIMSTPPQKWRLEIDTGQKNSNTQQYAFKNLRWYNDHWQFKSKAATQEKKNSDVFLFDTIYGETTPQQVNLIADESLFNALDGALKGNNLVVKAHNNNWEISAKHYQSNYPWSTLKLKQVKGKFQR